MNKKNLSERDICTKYIQPAIVKAGWDIQNQVLEEVSFTEGRISVRGNLHSRTKPQRADYVLYYQQNRPIAVIEAKKNTHKLGFGMQQALVYAESLEIPFVFSSNGDGFLFHDRTGLFQQTEIELSLDEFPSPETLWKYYCRWQEADVLNQSRSRFPYYEGKTKPRYYQYIAIDRTLKAIIQGQQRILLVMATGTGKTYTAFQIIWRLWKAKHKKRILFLADRNILVDQAKNQDFAPFASAMTKIENRQVDKHFDIYLALYQAVTGEAEKDIYKQFPPAFFDLVIVDECHRGSAKEDSAWREVLEYFSNATHIGLTATPKETKDVSNITYFGEPIYTYSLKQGIEDGFLAPYKVIRITTDKDKHGYKPEEGKTDKNGKELEYREYGTSDFDRHLVLEKRTQLVAKKVWEYLTATEPMAKTIVFCDDQEHAERMRQALVNIIPEAASNRRYVMRITGDDKDGKAELFNFIDLDEDYPVIATTSKLLTTGVDAKTCKLIVLDQNINSMTEFKQIIGRGTRLREDYNKFFFTIMDFKNATRLFADPDFDGEPVVVYEPKEGDSVVPPEDNNQINDKGQTSYQNENMETEQTTETNDENAEKREKLYLDDINVTVSEEITQHLNANGILTVHDLRIYSKQRLNEEFGSLQDFLRRWQQTERKEKILSELETHDLPLELLKAAVPNSEELDIFDLIVHIAFDQKPLTRSERAKQVKKQDYFAKYGEQAQKVLEALLDKYTLQGIKEIENPNILNLPPFDGFGGKKGIRRNIFKNPQEFSDALTELENAIYQQQ